MDWQTQIVVDPAVANGRPTLRTSKTLLLPIVDQLLAGTQIEQIRTENPQITDEEVGAVIGYTRLRATDRQPTRKQQLAIITELIGLVSFSFGYGLSLATIFSYEIFAFIVLALIVTWLSRRFQLLDYLGKVSSFRIKPIAMIGAVVVGFSLRLLIPEPPFIPALLLGATLLSISELCNENRYIRWLSWGKEINTVLMSMPVLLLVIFVVLRLIGGGSLSIYDSLLLIAYSIFGGAITALTYRRFIKTVTTSR